VNETWRNWAGNQRCSPQRIARPSTLEELKQEVQRAAEKGWTVRVAGTGHSFTDAVVTPDLLVSLEKMNRVLRVDPGSRHVRVQAGITLHALNEQLALHHLALENLGDVDVQTIAGATATGTHGTGARLPNLSANLHSMELLLADGTTLEVNEHTNATMWRAARVSLGALGIVTAVTLRTVPAFTLRGVDRPRPLDEVMDRMDELVADNDHFEFYMFPHSKLAQTRTNNRTDEPPRPRSRFGEFNADLLTNQVFSVISRTGRRFPSLISHLNKATARGWGKSTRVDRSDRIFTSTRKVRFIEMEYAIPRAAAHQAVGAVHRASERHDLFVSFPIEVRFGASDDALISPAAERDSCFISVHVFEGMQWEPYFRIVEAIMDDLDGRPHWGKYHFQTADTLRGRYPGWERFEKVRQRLDPHRRFTNDYVRRVLGP
jgi:L-gulonolactone oxidase